MFVVTKSQYFFSKVCEFTWPSAKFLKVICRPASQGIFPDHMKLALITTVNKGRSKLEVLNYRSIFILPVVSKVLEKFMLNRQLHFQAKIKLFTNTRLDFKKEKKFNQKAAWTSFKEFLIPQAKVTQLAVFSFTLKKPLTTLTAKF